MQKIIPNLWFDDQAEEAAKYYTSIFENSKITNVARYGKSGAEVSGKPEGSVMTVAFELDGVQLVAINGGPQFKFSEAISLEVICKTQEEIDDFWAKLSAGGEEGPCGWLKDKYGLSWQVVPTGMEEIFADPDPSKAERAMKAMLQMKKLDVAELKKAAAGK